MFLVQPCTILPPLDVEKHLSKSLKKKKQKFLFIFKTFIFFKLTVLGLFNVVLSNFVRYIIG